MWILPFLRSEVTKSIESISLSNFASSIPNLTEVEIAFENAYFSKIRTSSGSSGLKKIFLKMELNTSYLTDSYIAFTLKMESVSKITIFGLKVMMKSGLEKIFLKFLHAEAIFF